MHHKILHCGTPQTIIYACAWFICYFDFCLIFYVILISVWVFCYTIWHVHFLTLDASEPFFANMLSIVHPNSHSVMTRLYLHIYLCENKLDVLCLQAHYPFYLHSLWTYSQSNRAFNASKHTEENAILLAHGLYKWIMGPNLPVTWWPSRKRYICTKVRVSRPMYHCENFNKWIYHIGILAKIHSSNRPGWKNWSHCETV